MESASIPVPPGLNNNRKTILAPFLYGAIVASLFMGVLTMQTALYYTRYPKDRLYYKLTVGLLTLLSVVAWASTLVILNHAFISGFGNVLAMHAWPRVTFVPIAVPAFSGTLSQGFFATRIYRLSGQKLWLGVILVALIITSFVAGLASIALEPRSTFTPFNGSDLVIFKLADPEIQATFNKIVTSIQVFLWTQAATDVVISALLCYYLLGERRRNDKQIGITVTKVLAMGLTTGGATALFSVAVAVLVLTTVWSNNVNMSLTLSLTHVYALVCVSSLNVRRAINPRRKDSSISQSGPSMSQFSGHGVRPTVSTYASPVEKPSLSSLRATASLQATAATLTAGAPPFAHPKRPAPPKLRTSDLARDADRRFDSAHTMETGISASSVLSPEKDNASFPMLKGDPTEPVTMPRFSYLAPAPAGRRRDGGPRRQYTNNTPR